MPLVPKSYIQDAELVRSDVPGRHNIYGDFFRDSKTVKELTYNTFSDFLMLKDVTLVLFYDTNHPDSFYAKRHLEEASVTTLRPMSSFAGVNCRKEEALCALLDVTSLPSYKIFSRGNLVSTIQEYSTFTHDLMKQYVDKCPILPKPILPRPPCQSSTEDKSKPFWLRGHQPDDESKVKRMRQIKGKKKK